MNYGNLTLFREKTQQNVHFLYKKSNCSIIISRELFHLIFYAQLNWLLNLTIHMRNLALCFLISGNLTLLSKT